MRTETHPSAESLREAAIPFESFDELYGRCRNYDTLTRAVVREIKRRARTQRVCYCVDGDITEDRAAQLLAGGRGVSCIPGVPKAAWAAGRAGVGGAYTASSAFGLSSVVPSLPLVVYDVAERGLAGDVKLRLCERFGDEAPAVYIRGDVVRRIALYEADRQEAYDAQTALVLPDVPLLEKKRFWLDDFLAVLRRLRAPDGCPWDRAQTHGSIRINAIEEAYELVDAIDADDPDKMCEEAGDVFMQAAFHALMEEERGHFTMGDVFTVLCRKLIDRHTHVFGADRAAGADGALTVWDRNKMAEKHQATFSDSVNDVPEGFPALLRAQKICKRMAKGGWKFDTFGRLQKKLVKKTDALARAEGAEKERLLGDILMYVCRMGRLAGVECEQALLDTAKRAQRRYAAFEALVAADGKDVNALTEEEFRAYRRAAKAQEENDAND